MGDENSIDAEIAKRKQRARDLKIVDNVFKLYQEQLRYLTGDFAGGENSRDQKRLPGTVSGVSKHSSREGIDKVQTFDISLGEYGYSFFFKEHDTEMPDGKVITFGRLGIQSKETLVLEIKCICQEEKYGGTKWAVSDISAFIEGQWVEIVNEFAEQTFSLVAERVAKAQEERRLKELEEQRKKFGL